MGRPRVHASDAQRQRAYRERLTQAAREPFCVTDAQGVPLLKLERAPDGGTSLILCDGVGQPALELYADEERSYVALSGARDASPTSAARG